MKYKEKIWLENITVKATQKGERKFRASLIQKEEIKSMRGDL